MEVTNRKWKESRVWHDFGHKKMFIMMVVRIIIMLKKTNTMTCSCCIKLTITMTTDNNNSSNNNDNNDNNITMADDSSIIIIIPMLKPLNHPSIHPYISLANVCVCICKHFKNILWLARPPKKVKSTPYAHLSFFL